MRSARLMSSALVVVAIAAIGVVWTANTRLRPVEAEGVDPRIPQGFAIAPVFLNLAGRDYNKVGLGSYLVNAVGDCNGCHSSNSAPLALYPYITGKNPYFHQPEKIDPSVYLAGGQSFGTVGTPTGPNGYGGPAIITRNLTPDKNGLPEGGHTLAQFKQIMRHGTDFDHIHPTCTPAQIAAINRGASPVCIPTGAIVYDAAGDTYNNIPDGNLLQIMPWPTFSRMTDDDLEAIYEYLSAIPCLDNTWSTPPAGAPNELRNDCGTGAFTANAAGKKPAIQQAP
jgi:hypothetical protein